MRASLYVFNSIALRVNLIVCGAAEIVGNQTIECDSVFPYNGRHPIA